MSEALFVVAWVSSFVMLPFLVIAIPMGLFTKSWRQNCR